jgi:hypothetical protein
MLMHVPAESAATTETTVAGKRTATGDEAFILVHATARTPLTDKHGRFGGLCLFAMGSRV